jgi:Ca-activated chloride channel homolog
MLLVLGSCSRELAGQVAAPGPTFKSSVDLVTLNVTVQKNGRMVPGLTSADFELLDAGEPRPIVSFQTETSPIGIALLFDASGSMDVASKAAAGRQAAHHLLSWLEPGRDQVGVFTFDTQLQQRQAFTTSRPDITNFLDAIRPFGSTSLYDAIAETGRQVAAIGGPRRAVVVITDGADNRSQLTPSQVSGVASGLDVPVYVIVISAAIDHQGTEGSIERHDAPKRTGALDDLAQATGGALFTVSAPAHASVAARQIIEELRHQYLIAFEPSQRAGWHPLSVRTRDPHFVVRARSGYVAGSRPAHNTP